MTENFHRPFRLLLIAAIAVLIGACSAKSASTAEAGPSKATIEKLIEKSHGGQTASRKFQFHSIKVAKSHVTKIAEIYGIRGGTRVWPVLASFTEYTSGGPDVTKPWSVCDRGDDVQFYYFFKNQFGDWAGYASASSENLDKSKRYAPCTKMPGVSIYTHTR